MEKRNFINFLAMWDLAKSFYWLNIIGLNNTKRQTVFFSVFFLGGQDDCISLFKDDLRI